MIYGRDFACKDVLLYFLTVKFWLNVFIVVMVHIERALVDAGVACTVKDRACPSEDVEHSKTYLF